MLIRRYVTASGHGVGRAHGVGDRRGEEEPERGEHHAQAGGEPQPVDAELGRTSAIAGADLAGGDRGGGGIGEEVEQRARR